MFSSKKEFAVLAHLPVKATRWGRSALSLEELSPTICFLQRTRRRTRPSNKVRTSLTPNLSPAKLLTEAAIDANAPLEDEEAANGPVDSDEELTAVMHGLSHWNPQPVVPPLIQMPIEREYQKKRLYEQLHHATNGFTVNICKVVGYGAQKLAPGHPGLLDGEGDADGDIDAGLGLGPGIQNMANRRASALNLSLPPSRRTSIVSQR